MRYKLLFFMFVLALFSFSDVSAIVSEEDKSALAQSLEIYKNDPTKLTLILAVADAKMDLSDEPELRQKVLDTATAAGVDVSRYKNLIGGTVPLAVQQEQGLQEISTSQGLVQTTPLAADSQKYSTGTIILLVVIVAAIVVIGWIYGKKKGTK